jgi:hypothetical protein
MNKQKDAEKGKNKMTDKATCSTCKYYRPMGREDSGLLLPDQSGKWFYTIGQCLNSNSVHGGWDANPTKSREGRKTLPSWCSCWLWEKKRQRRKKRTATNK